MHGAVATIDRSGGDEPVGEASPEAASGSSGEVEISGEAEDRGEGVAQPGLRGRAPLDASPGPGRELYDGREKGAEPSDAWWIASERDVLPKFSLFEHEFMFPTAFFM